MVVLQLLDFNTCNVQWSSSWLLQDIVKIYFTRYYVVTVWEMVYENVVTVR